MGDCQTGPLRPQFDRRLRLEFHGAKVTSDAGLLAYREFDDALDLTDSAAAELHDTRTGQNARHSLIALSRQSIFSRLAGYEDLNDAQRLRVDPAMRTIVGGRAKDHTAASTSEIARFETETLSTRANRNRLLDLSGQGIDHAYRHRKLTKLPLSGDVVGPRPAGRSQDRMARGRVVPPRRIRGDQPEAESETGDQILQREGYGGAMDQGGEERGEVDAAVMPSVQGQPGAASAVRARLQPWELLAAAGTAPGGEALELDDAAGEADQDRSQGRRSFQGGDVPDGGGGGASHALRGDPGPDRSAAARPRDGLRDRVGEG